MSTTMRTQDGTTTIEAAPDLPLIRMTRDFAATPAQLVKAHTDPELFVQWVGPNSTQPRVVEWDARTGGSYRYLVGHDGEEYGFHGCFHEVSEERLVQTFTFEGMPEGVSLDTMWFEDLGDGHTRMHATSLVDSFEARDGMLSSGMDVGVNDGYAKLDRLLSDGAL
jgi:uncharacterized protein YndB with AHSA1/START domain